MCLFLFEMYIPDTPLLYHWWISKLVCTSVVRNAISYVITWVKPAAGLLSTFSGMIEQYSPIKLDHDTSVGLDWQILQSWWTGSWHGPLGVGLPSVLWYPSVRCVLSWTLSVTAPGDETQLWWLSAATVVEDLPQWLSQEQRNSAPLLNWQLGRRNASWTSKPSHSMGIFCWRSPCPVAQSRDVSLVSNLWSFVPCTAHDLCSIV